MTRIPRPRSVAFHLVSPDPEPGVRLLRVEGPLSTADHPQLRGLLNGASAENGVATRAIVVDLRGCNFMAAICLREMMDVSDELSEQGGWGVKLVIDETSTLERRMWAVMGRQRLATYSSASSAVLSSRGPSPV
jgi:anti-anti-sigma regulatory factor